MLSEHLAVSSCFWFFTEQEAERQARPLYPSLAKPQLEAEEPPESEDKDGIFLWHTHSF
jgi:hypothetical protein